VGVKKTGKTIPTATSTQPAAQSSPAASAAPKVADSTQPSSGAT
jgi:hypothetical protein